MNTKPEPLELYVDVVTGYNNGVWAMYIVGKDVLEVENQPKLVGVPFVAWTGSWAPIGPSVEKARLVNDIPYLSMNQFEYIKAGGIIGKGPIPQEVQVHGKTISIKTLVPIHNSMYRTHVLYSSGIFHDDDVERDRPVRDLADYQGLVHMVLPEVMRIRKERTKTLERDAGRLNQFLARIGRYTPSTFGPFEPAL